MEKKNKSYIACEISQSYQKKTKNKKQKTKNKKQVFLTSQLFKKINQISLILLIDDTSKTNYMYVDILDSNFARKPTTSSGLISSKLNLVWNS